MNIVVLTTGTNNTQTIYRPLFRLGHKVSTIVYDAMEPGHAELPCLVSELKPDVVVLIGALEAHHGKPVPPVSILHRIGARHLMVHICCDGAEPLWWNQLERYYDSGAFALQVNIDGVRTGPIGDRGLTMLCPVDAADYGVPPLWRDRKVAFGFGGNTHHGVRENMLAELVRRGLVYHRGRDDELPEGYRDFLKTCRCAWNHPMTGGTTSNHVKARILEAALAGCLVFEAKGSPAETWFEPSVDYVAYKDEDDIASWLQMVEKDQDEAESMAMAFRAKVIAEHAPEIFWNQVFHRLGIVGQIRPLKQVPYRPWRQHYHCSDEQPVVADVPRLVGKGDRCNYVAFRGAVYSVPWVIGPIELDKADLIAYPTIRKFASLEEASR